MMEPPLPYFGGKAKIASYFWKRFGKANIYLEPFAGMAATILLRPTTSFPTSSRETINDNDAMIANFFRSLKIAPEEVFENAEDPPIEVELVARQRAIVEGRDRLQKMLVDVNFCDPKLAGWFMYCRAHAVRPRSKSNKPELDKPSFHAGGMLSKKRRDNGLEEVTAFKERLRDVRICFGDYKRLLVDAEVKVPKAHIVAILADPPYRKTGTMYAEKQFDHAPLLERCVELGRRENVRIALCGYWGDYTMPDDWTVERWYPKKKSLETVWYSPACKHPEMSSNWENKAVVGNVFEEMYAEPPRHPLERLFSILRREEVED